MINAVQKLEPEQRRAPRQRALMGGRIRFNRGSSSLDCIVRDMSDSGFRLSASQSVALPDEFELSIPKKNATFRVRIVWRDSEGLGVIVSAAKPQLAGGAALQERGALEAELTRLQNRIAQLTEG